jgi:hypothetical protein
LMSVELSLFLLKNVLLDVAIGMVDGLARVTVLSIGDSKKRAKTIVRFDVSSSLPKDVRAAKF